MDATEVTNANYAAFLAADYPTEGQRAECSWNTTYVPAARWPASGREDYPVDWCDAAAFCEWAGKRLCGKIGGGLIRSPRDPRRSEWMNACEGGDGVPHVYRGTPTRTACNTTYTRGSGAWPVGSSDLCEGGFPGLFDLPGNVWEWVDGCDDDYGCGIRGGSFNSSNARDGFCGYAWDEDPDTADERHGFRCCADALESDASDGL